MRDEMNVRDVMREKEKARKWWDALPTEQRWSLGDDLVLGAFSWVEWGFTSRPSRAFMNEVDYLRMLWEG